MTIGFIQFELDELAREELYRIKKVKKIKATLTGKAMVKKKPSPIDLEPQKSVSQPKPCPSTPAETPKYQTVRGITCVVCGSGMVSGEKVFDRGTEEKLKLLRNLLQDIMNISKFVEDFRSTGLNIVEFLKTSEDVKTKIDQYFNKGDVTVDDLKSNMAKLKGLLDEVKKTVHITDKSPNLGRLCLKCAEFEQILNQCCCFKGSETKVTKPIESASHEFTKPHSFLCSEYFKPKTIEVPKMRIPDYMIKTQPSVLPCQECHTTHTSEKERVSTGTRLTEFEKHVDDVIAMTNSYKEQGLLTPSVTEFVESCKSVKVKIANHKIQQENKIKLKQLKENVARLEAITCLVQTEELDDTNIMSFMVRCRQFKEKLEERRPYRGFSLDKLVNDINNSIMLTNEVKNEGLVSGYVDEYIKSCQAVTAKLTSPSETLTDETKGRSKLDNLILQISNILSAIKTYKEEGMLSKSVEEFYRTCLATKAILEQSKRQKTMCKCAQKEALNVTCACSRQFVAKKPCSVQSTSPSVQATRCCSEGSVAICHSNTVGAASCPKPKTEPCHSMSTVKCLTCKTSSPKIPVNTTPETPGCLKFSVTEQVRQKDITKPIKPTSKISSIPTTPGKSEQASKASKTSSGCSFLTKTNSGKSLTNVCESCFKAMKKSSPSSVAKTYSNHGVDARGYYEKQTSKTKTTRRFREKDGTIKKSCETVITTRKKYDPRRTPTSSDVFEYEPSYESVKSTKQVHLCEIPQTKGFIQTVRPVRSEIVIRTLDLTSDNAIVWSSVSEDSVVFRRKNEEEFFGFCDPYFCTTTPNSIDSRVIFPI